MNRVTRHSFTAQDKQHICYGVDVGDDNASFSSYFSLYFLLCLSLSLSPSPALYLSVSSSVYLSSLIRRRPWNGATALCGRRLCVICRLRLDLFHVIPQIETNTRGLASSHPCALFKLLFCCCFNVSYIFHGDRAYDHMPAVIALFQ